MNTSFSLFSISINKFGFFFFQLIDFRLENNFQSFLYRNHYTQHSQSVEAARRGAAARLENFGGNTQQTVVPSEELCGLCER